MSVCLYICMSVCLYVCMYVYMYVCMYLICIYLMDRNRVSCKKKKKLKFPSLISPPPDAVHGGKVLRYGPPGAGVVLLPRICGASCHSFAEHCFHTF